MILQLRAPMGGGKTYTARKVIEVYKCKEVAARLGGKGSRPEAYVSAGAGLAVLGSYVAACGGMDGVNSVSDSIELIYKYASTTKKVFYEGMMLGHIFGRHGEAMLQRYGQDHLFVFIDAPLELCIERVRARRDARGASGKNFDPKNVVDNYKAVWSSYDRVLCNGGNAVKIDHGKIVPYVLKKLK